MEMKTSTIIAALIALVAVASLAFVACGGDGDGDGTVGNIRTEKGFDAAVAAGAPVGESVGEGDDGAGTITNVGAPQPAADFDTVESGLGGDVRGIAPYPFAQQVAGGEGLTVQGYGTATADADAARIELYFSRYSERGDEPVPEPLPPDTDAGGAGSSSGADGPAPGDLDFELQEVSPITQEELQPVIDALEDAGATDVEFVAQGYFDPYYASASIRATVENIDSVEDVVAAGREAASALENIEQDSSNVGYTVSDCAALQQAALATAIEDAGDNAAIFATALGVEIGEIIGAADFSYHGEEACDNYYGYYPVYEDIAFSAQPAEVQAWANVSITYAIQ